MDRLRGLLPLATLVFVATSFAPALATWPNGPFATSGRWMVDASGANVSYAGVNWPGSVDTMVPEGLQYQSVETIVAKIKSLGMNAIRLTYAIEMIDQIYENGGNDVSIQNAFTTTLGQDNGTAVYGSVIKNNPSFNASTTRLQVFDAIAAECAKQEIYVHLDNHISLATWCCTPFDGNSWWGDTYFDPGNWTRGLAYMANHGKSWSNLMSMSLRNELRQPLNNNTLYEESYNWQTWYTYVKQGASAIHSANPDVLIFLSGINSDTDLSAVANGTPLTPGTGTFSAADFPAGKIVLELHDYDFSQVAANCSDLEAILETDGFDAVDPTSANRLPLVMTEWGFAQDGTSWQGVYGACLEQSFLPRKLIGWTVWVLAGSYYTRQGVQDMDESWGLLTHDWSAWRDPSHINGGLMPLVKLTLADTAAAANASSNSTGGGSGSGAGSPKKNEADQQRVDVLSRLAILLLFGCVAVL